MDHSVDVFWAGELGQLRDECIRWGDCWREGAIIVVNAGQPIVTTGDFVVYWCKSAWGDRVAILDGELGWPRDGCIRWGPHLAREWEVWGFFSPIEWRFSMYF